MKDKIMKNKIRYMALAALVAVFSIPAAQAADDIQQASKDTVDAFKKADPSMKTFFDTSTGYAVFPDIGKGGFIVGGAHGKGLVYETNKLIGRASMTQASIGAQAGGQTFAQIIFFETPDVLNDFKSSKFEMSADASAVAAAQGVAATARFRKGVAVFALPKKGLMAEASVGGQRFKFEPLLEPTGRTESEPQPGQPAQPPK
jgi:lipid-binding SYLF domain-containing protein